jgi:hypothetical protein
MANEYSTVDCSEMQGTAVEHFQWGEGWTASVDLLVTPYDNRLPLMADILRNRRIYPKAGGYLGARAIGASAKPFEAQSQPYSSGSQALLYDSAVVTVNYDSRLPQTDLFTETIEPVIDYITLDYRRFRFKSCTGLPLQEAESPGKQLWGFAYVRTFFKVLPPLNPLLLTLPGSVNIATFTSANLGWVFAPETLLFCPTTMTRTVSFDLTSLAYDVTIKFLFKPEGWNNKWNANDEEFQQIYRVIEASGSGSGGGTLGCDVYKNYPLADFSAFLY